MRHLIEKLDEIVGGEVTEAMGGNVVTLHKKSDIEFLLNLADGFLQIGMGGEWWSGQVKMGKNVFHHRKEGHDSAYRPVTVVMKDKGDDIEFDVSGGFGNEGTIVIGAK